MSRDRDKDESREQDRAIEREARAGRRNEPWRGIAGRDGGDHLRGASPTPLLRRAELELEQWLREQLPSPDQALATVLLRHLTARPDRTADGLGHPARTVAATLPELLDSRPRLTDFVREVDMTWGQLNDERPYFERPDRPPDPDDPYTLESVTASLERLLARARGQL
jgi:hypothetical protein